jgi:ribosomal protein S18 acetylase RimI-like enzyme
MMTFDERTRERSGLSEHELGEVRSLIGQCLPVDVNIIVEASDGHQFLRYQGDTLLGVLGLRHDGEACLCVAPDARRRGVGRALMLAADDRLAREGIAEMVVECDAASREGRAFLNVMEGTFSGAEFRLRLTDSKALRPSAGKVQLGTVGPEGIAAFAAANAASFGDSVEPKLSQFQAQVGTARYRFYLARVGGRGVAGIRAAFCGAETHLTAFHTLPEARRRGYGRDLLLQTCRALIDEGKDEIILEVRTDNEAALGLYRSCGFDVVRRYDFYRRRVGAGTLAGSVAT